MRRYRSRTFPAFVVLVDPADLAQPVLRYVPEDGRCKPSNMNTLLFLIEFEEVPA